MRRQDHPSDKALLIAALAIALRAVLACFSAEQTCFPFACCLARKVRQQAAVPRSREETADEFCLVAGAAEAGHGGFDFGGLSGKRRGGSGDGRATQQRLVQRGTGQREVVEGDVEQPVLRLDNLERLRRAVGDGAVGDGAAGFERFAVSRDASAAGIVRIRDGVDACRVFLHCKSSSSNDCQAAF